MQYPIAEIFHSIQGEGVWTGTPMMFVRLAGCCVGEYITPKLAEEEQEKMWAGNSLKLFRSAQHSICTTFDGQRFLCDTDYHAISKMTAEEIAAELEDEWHVCITGGEPLMHDLAPLVKALGVRVHIETSGTLPPQRCLDSIVEDQNCWITISPKRRCLDLWFNRANEFKLLIGPSLDKEAFEWFYYRVEDKESIFLQPINGVKDIDEENMQRVLNLLKKYPQCRLSAQLHKYIKVR